MDFLLYLFGLMNWIVFFTHLIYIFIRTLHRDFFRDLFVFFLLERSITILTAIFSIIFLLERSITIFSAFSALFSY